jgi:predicted AAA+ superfamily ATPase
VGKSTALRQVITHLLARGGDPHRTVYFSFDDPARFVDPTTQRRIFDQLIEEFVDGEHETVFFFDEISACRLGSSF